jgi:hypothetical protein
VYLRRVVVNRGLPLWSSGQRSWLQSQRSGFDSRRYHIFWEVVGLERGPPSIVSTIEELLERKSSGFGLENRYYGHRDPSRWPRDTIYPQKLALTSPDRRWSLNRYSSLADSDHGVCCFFVVVNRAHAGFLSFLMLALTSPTSGCRSVGVVRSQTQSMEFFFLKYVETYCFRVSTLL